MNIEDISARVRAAKATLSHKVFFEFTITGDTKTPCAVSCAPMGFGSENPYKSFGAATPEEAFRLADDWLRDHSAAFRTAQIRKMATAIIVATDENGACTTASLRLAGFGDADIAAFGAEAVAKADEMAGRGPFAIVAIESANAA